jgi:hypothetical protein
VRTERPIHYFGEWQTILETPAGAACCYGAAAHGRMPGSTGLLDVIAQCFTIFVIVHHDALAKAEISRINLYIFLIILNNSSLSNFLFPNLISDI